MADEGFEYENVVEVYGKKIYPQAKLHSLDIYHSRLYLKVKWRRFTRTIFRPTQGYDVFVEQEIDNSGWFFHSGSLPIEAMNNEHELCDAISDLPPVLESVQGYEGIADQWGNIQWDEVASGLSEFATSQGVFPSLMIPFGVRGDLAFGMLKIIREEEEHCWGQGYWSEKDPKSERVETCLICLDEYNFEDPDHVNGIKILLDIISNITSFIATSYEICTVAMNEVMLLIMSRRF